MYTIEMMGRINATEEKFILVNANLRCTYEEKSSRHEICFSQPQMQLLSQ